MNQLDYKKKYDEALERMRSWARGEHPECFTEAQKAAEFVFPELKESEDERTKKELLEYLKGFIPHHDLDLVRKSKVWIAWLEKQGEQRETNLVEILKHYPRETELYSPLYGKLWLAEVDEKHEIITCYKHRLDEGCTRATLEQEDTVSFYSNGTTGLPDFSVSEDCMLFLYDSEKQGEQPYWKPSEEQLQTLHTQLNEGAVTYPEDKHILFTLYEDLMKIMTQEEKQGEKS